FHPSSKTIAPSSRAMLSVRSVEPESTTTRSSAKATLAKVRPILLSSFRVMITTERLMPGQDNFRQSRAQRKTRSDLAAPGSGRRIDELFRGLLCDRRCPILQGSLRRLLLLSWCRVGSWSDVRDSGLLRHGSVEGIIEHDAVANQRIAGHAIEFYARLYVRSTRSNTIAICGGQVGFSLQHGGVGPGARGVLRLLSVETLLREFERLVGGFDLCAILLHGELRVADLDGYLILQLL